MNKKKEAEAEDFKLSMVDEFLKAAGLDLEEMRKVITNLRLFDVNTPARLVARCLLLTELADLQTELAQIIAGLTKNNTVDTVALVGEKELKAESEELLANISVEKKKVISN